jgi:20S proteasome alpha/beta subunit
MKGKYNNLTREIISQQLNDVTILCEKTVKESDGNYSTYVAVEMNKDALKKALENKISSSAKLNIDYDKMKFEQIYNEEMKKLDDAKK